MADSPLAGGEWLERPWLARLVRGAVIAAPVIVSALITRVVVTSLTPHELGVNRWLWLLGAIAVSLSAFVLTDRLARQLLPLAALLRLSLVFPNEAPSRFRVAMRSTTTRSVERRLEAARETAEQSEEKYVEIMLELVARLSKHDRLTRGHMERVKAYSEMIGEELELGRDDLNRLRWAALLHDVGKLKVPAYILQKNGRPTDHEWEILKTHPAESVLLLAPLSGWLGDWRHAADQHHERWDGGGYPRGLKGDAIHLAGRIAAVADAYDVMTSARSYKKPMSAKVARAEIARCAGAQFDPAVARAFLNLSVGRLRLVLGPVSWLANLPAALASLAPAASPVAGGLTALSIAAAGSLGVVFDPPLDSLASEVAAPRVDAAPSTTAGAGASSPGQSSTTSVSSGTGTASTTTTTTTTTTAAPSTTVAGAPIVSDASLSTQEDEPLSFTLLATSPDAVTITITRPPRRATLVAGDTARDGSRYERPVVYRPGKDDFGDDVIEYEACTSAGRCSRARVSMTITPVNDPPVAVAKSLSVPRNGTNTIKATDLIAGATDVDGDSISVLSVSNGAKGTVSYANGEYTYQANFGNGGRDDVVFTLTDSSGATSTGTLSIMISGAPPSAVNDSLSALVGTPTRLDVEANDVDPDGGTLRVVAIDAGVHPAWIDQGRAYFEPRPGFSGVVAGTYTVEDGDGLRASASFTVSVGAPVALYSGPARGQGEDKLDGAVVSGLIYVYLETNWTDVHIDYADFWIDGGYVRRDAAWTFDVWDTAYDTTKLTNGVHRLQVTIVPAGGGPAVNREFIFTVAN